MRCIIAVVLAVSLVVVPASVRAQTSSGLVAGVVNSAVTKSDSALLGPPPWEHRVAFGLVGGVLGHLFARQGLRSFGVIGATAPAGGGFGLGELLTLSTSLSVLGVAIGATAGYLVGWALYPDRDEILGQD
ncbi:membrane hypothetical protein [uncultured Gammaproteobacteria bacterium]